MKSVVTLRYGTIRIDGFRQIDGAGWVRDENYTSNDGGQPIRQHTHVAGRGDCSAPHSIYADYNPACSMCWLNHPHSEQLHAAKVAPQV